MEGVLDFVCVGNGEVEISLVSIYDFGGEDYEIVMEL